MGIRTTYTSTFKWRSYKSPSSPILAECGYVNDYYAHERGQPRMHYLHHSRQISYVVVPGDPRGNTPINYEKAVDMSVGWTDGHVISIVNSKTPAVIYEPIPLAAWQR